MYHNIFIWCSSENWIFTIFRIDGIFWGGVGGHKFKDVQSSGLLKLLYSSVIMFWIKILPDQLKWFYMLITEYNMSCTQSIDSHASIVVFITICDLPTICHCIDFKDACTLVNLWEIDLISEKCYQLFFFVFEFFFTLQGFCNYLITIVSRYSNL